MAIDTAKKRLSALNFGRGILLPLPDGTIDSGDQATLLNLYNGFALDPPVVDDDVSGLSPIEGLSALEGLSPIEGLGGTGLEKFIRIAHTGLEWLISTGKKGIQYASKTQIWQKRSTPHAVRA